MQGSDNTSSASSPHCRNPISVPTSVQPSPLTLLQQQTASTQPPPPVAAAVATSSSSSSLSPLAAYAASLSQSQLGAKTPSLKPHTPTAPSVPKASPLLAYASSLAHQQKAPVVESAGRPPSSTLVSTGEQSMGTLAGLAKPHTDNSEEDYDV